ncbi:Dihydrodipicolinate synthase [Ceratocystis pirilliformis]|uniref:Dihydrodipicolinate synthase n=1 Tax=Ceratocystis pirilliformis TaxID=259994 RepID=A0ABR3YNQ6_9PEZI
MDHVVQTVVNEASKAAATADQEQWLIFGFLTPVNTVLVTLILFCISGWIFAPDFPKPQRPKPARVFEIFTPRTLRPYVGGGPGQPIYLAVRGRVFDVSARPEFYGPEGSYANFAGRDASRGLACGSFDEDMLTMDLDAPLDSLDNLTEEQLEALAGWEESFRAKYTVIGKLVSQADFDKTEKK